MVNPSKKLDSNKLIKNKIHTFLAQKTNNNGNSSLLTCRGFFTTTKIGFYIFGIYGVFAALLNLLIAYMALTSTLKDDFRLIYRSFIFPCVLLGILCVTALIIMYCKNEWAACFVSISAAFPLIIHFIQISKNNFTASYKTQLLVIDSIIFMFLICSILILIFKCFDKKLEDKILFKALNHIYESNRIEDGVMNEEQLIKAIEDYKPHL